MAGPVAAFLTKTFGSVAAQTAFAASKTIPLWASVTAHVITAGASMIGSALLTPKNRFGQSNDRNSLLVRGANSLGSTTSRQYIYGQVKVGGTIVYLGTSDFDSSVTGNDNKYLHMALVHCDHETEELGDLYVNGEVVDFSAYSSDGALRSATGTRYSGSLSIADHHGGPSQAVNSTLDAAMGNWGSNDKLSGMSYTYIRMLLKDGDENAFPTGIPQFQRVVKGRKVYDPRESSHDASDSTTWTYSANWALCVADFLQSEFGYGRVGLGHSKINETELIASANNSDETVNSKWDNWSASEEVALNTQRLITEGAVLVCTTAGTTGTSEPAGPYSGGETNISDGTAIWSVLYADPTGTENRYELNGIVNSDEDPMEVVRSMRTAADGLVEYIGGEWFIRSGRYITPTITLSESDFAGPISGTTKDDRTVSVNTIKGVISNKDDAYNVIDVPSFTNATYVTQDNGIVATRELELLFTNSPGAAQRLFKIALAKARQQISHKATFTAKAMQLQVGDNFKLDFAKYGYSSTASTPTTFQVWSHQLKIGGNGELLVDMEFREIASNTYDWDATTDQTTVDPAPTSFLPDPFTVTAPTGMAATSGTDQLIDASDGTILPTVLVTWTGASDVNVIGYQIRWKYVNVSTDTQYRYLTVNGRNNTSLVITGVRESRSDANRYINIDIRSITPIKEGEWTVVEHNHNVIGKSAAPTDPSSPTVAAVENGVAVTFSEHPDLDFFNYHIWVQTSSSPPTHTGTGPFSPLALSSTSGLTKTILGLDPSTTYYVFTAAMDSSRLFSDIVATTPATISPLSISADSSLGALASEDTVDLTTTGDGGVSGVLPTSNTDATDNGTTIDTSGNLNAAVNVNSSGALKVGKTSASSTTAGFWLGTDGSSDYDFHIGDASSSLHWDGSESSLTVKGDLTAGSVDIGTGFSRTQIDSTGISKWAGGRIQINASDSAFGDVGQKWLGAVTESIWIDCNTSILPANLYFGNVSTGAANAYITGQGNAQFKEVRVGDNSNDDLVIKGGATPGGSVSVGGSTSASVITTEGTSAGSFHVGVEIPSNDANDGFYVLTDSDSDGTVDTLALKIKANGFMGLRTNAPSARLTIGDGEGTSDHVYHNKSGSNAFPGQTSTSDHGAMLESQGANGSSLHVSRVDNVAANFARGGNGDVVVFRRTDGSVTEAGSIEITGATSVAYQTSSDYRLKENVVAISDATQRVKQLNAVRFNFIGEQRVLDGFLAHEVQDIVPEAISGTKDGMVDEEYEVSPAVYEERTIEAKDAIYDEDGELIKAAEAGQVQRVLVSEAVMGTRSVPKYQGIDQSKIVPLLTAALQEAVAKIEALEARVASLEG